MLRILIALCMCAYAGVSGAGEVKFLLDRSSSMDKTKDTDLIAVLTVASRTLAAVDEISIIPWNNNMLPAKTWDPTKQKLDHSMILAPANNTYLGSSIAEVFAMETSFCPRYLVVVDGKPSDQEEFKVAMAELHEFTTIVISVMQHESGYEKTREWYSKIETPAQYTVITFTIENLLSIAPKVMYAPCPIS